MSEIIQNSNEKEHKKLSQSSKDSNDATTLPTQTMATFFLFFSPSFFSIVFFFSVSAQTLYCNPKIQRDMQTVSAKTERIKNVVRKQNELENFYFAAILIYNNRPDRRNCVLWLNHYLQLQLSADMSVDVTNWMWLRHTHTQTMQWIYIVQAH